MGYNSFGGRMDNIDCLDPAGKIRYLKTANPDTGEYSYAEDTITRLLDVKMVNLPEKYKCFGEYQLTYLDRTELPCILNIGAPGTSITYRGVIYGPEELFKFYREFQNNMLSDILENL